MMLKINALGGVQYGRLPWDTWIANANHLLEYWQAGHVDDYPEAPWHKWWSNGCWVSAAVHRAIDNKI